MSSMSTYIVNVLADTSFRSSPLSHSHILGGSSKVSLSVELTNRSTGSSCAWKVLRYCFVNISLTQLNSHMGSPLSFIALSFLKALTHSTCIRAINRIQLQIEQSHIRSAFVCHKCFSCI